MMCLGKSIEPTGAVVAGSAAVLTRTENELTLYNFKTFSGFLSVLLGYWM